MPSPVGHSAVTLPLAAFLRPGTRRQEWLLVLALAAAANAPDLDFIPGILAGRPHLFHHGVTHSVGAALVFAAAVGLVARMMGYAHAVRIGLVFGVAYSSHLVLDMFTVDTRPIRGLAVLWPFTDLHFAAPVTLFLDIQRGKHSSNFFVSLLTLHNGIAVLWESILVGMAFGAVRFARWVRASFLTPTERMRARL